MDLREEEEGEEEADNASSSSRKVFLVGCAWLATHAALFNYIRSYLHMQKDTMEPSLRLGTDIPSLKPKPT